MGTPTNISVRCGVHVSIARTIDQAVDRAVELGCSTFQIFTRSPRSWKVRRLVLNEVTQFRKKVKEHNMQPVFAHMPYLPNLSSPNNTVYKKSVRALIEELDRCCILDIPYVVTHIGSHLGKGKRIGLERFVGAITTAFDYSKNNVKLLLENTAGTTNSMGSSFENIREIIDNIGKSRTAVCFDTCHAFAAGYDLRDAKSLEKTVNLLEDNIGSDLLTLVHANDSKGDLSSRLDRHEHIGVGRIGEKGFRALLHSSVFRKLPIILETPLDRPDADAMNLRRIHELSVT